MHFPKALFLVMGNKVFCCLLTVCTKKVRYSELSSNLMRMAVGETIAFSGKWRKLAEFSLLKITSCLMIERLELS